MAVVVLSVCFVGAEVLAQGDGSWDVWRGEGATDGKGGGAGGFSDQAVRKAIKKGCDYLWSQRKPDGSWEPFNLDAKRNYKAGPSSLAAYALLASGVSPLDKRMAQSLDWLAAQETNLTYTLGLRCNVWYLASKETGSKYRKFFRRDLARILVSTKNGSYNYWCNADGQSAGDNSNSQYAVLGAWAGAMAREEIRLGYWRKVLTHWTQCQHRDGGWGYSGGGGESSATMTAGGIATLFVCYDNLFPEKFLRCNVKSTYDKAIRAGLTWMDKHFGVAVGGKQHMGHGDLYYFLYGVERVGLASGYKYFGTQNWYKLGARSLLSRQTPNGSWPKGNRSVLVSTCFSLLFLVRGQHAVAFNKLEYEGDWNNRPRDLAGLTRWMTGSLERQLNWQIISMKSPVRDWHDAPILYIAGSQAPEMDDGHVAKLREFVQQGGTILSVAECGHKGKGFRQGIRKVYERVLPAYPLKAIPRDHELYRVHHQLAGQPELFLISNGIRPLVVHTDVDLARSWQLQMRRTSPRDFQVPANVLMYVTDKGLLRNRGVSHWPPRPPKAPSRTIKVTRVKHSGNWNPEPLAFERFGRLMALKHGIGIEVAGPVEVGQLAETGAKVATMTGTGAFTLSAEATASLKKWLEAGGTLVVDAAGGSRLFAESAEVMLRGMFGRRSVRRLSGSADLFKLPNMRIPSVRFRRQARVRYGLRGRGNLRGVQIDKRFAVIFSKHDLTGGLVGYPSYSCIGYEPASCFRIMRNAVLLAAGEKAR